MKLQANAKSSEFSYRRHWSDGYWIKQFLALPHPMMGRFQKNIGHTVYEKVQTSGLLFLYGPIYL